MLSQEADEVAGNSYAQWIAHDSPRLTFQSYCSRMANTNTEGGELAIVAFAACNEIHVLVFERRGSKFHCIACFSCATPTEKTHLLYVSRCDNDPLVGGQGQRLLDNSLPPSSGHELEPPRPEDNSQPRSSQAGPSNPSAALEAGAPARMPKSHVAKQQPEKESCEANDNENKSAADSF